MKKLLIAALLTAVACSSTPREGTQICAHRGFWKCQDVPNWENSIASLKMAQDYGFWGSEFDVHLTADDIVVVHHDDDKDGLRIADNTYEALAATPLPSGEILPTIDSYLDQGAKSKCVLVLEFKPGETPERREKMVHICFDALKARGLWSPDRVIFISFDLEICKLIAAEAPEFTNQFLSGNISPEGLNEMGINGLDYHYSVFYDHPEWVEEAHALGMSVNVWTVDSRQDMEYMAALGVDCITTNEPLLLKEVLESR